MEINSSDDDEEATNDTRTAMNPCEQQCQSGLQSAVNRCLRLLSINHLSCCVLFDYLLFLLPFIKSFWVVYNLTESNVGDWTTTLFRLLHNTFNLSSNISLWFSSILYFKNYGMKCYTDCSDDKYVLQRYISYACSCVCYNMSNSAMSCRMESLKIAYPSRSTSSYRFPVITCTSNVTSGFFQ